MSGPIADLGSLLATGLRGLRSRLPLTAGSVLLAAIAVAAAVVGPMYQSASTASYVVTTLRSQPNFVTGVTLDYTPGARVGSDRVREQARRAVQPGALAHFRGPELSLWARQLPVGSWPDIPGGDPQATLVAESGACRRLVVEGSCPNRSGETLILESVAAYTHTEPGDRLEVGGLPQSLKVVGTYRLPSGGGEWFNPVRFTSVAPQQSRGSYRPYAPAPFVVTAATVACVDTGTWFVRMDYRLNVPASTTLDDLRQAAHEVSGLPGPAATPQSGDSLRVEPGNALAPAVAGAQERRNTAAQTVTPAVASLILIALVLLVRLLAAAMDLRRHELALASLRGIRRRQLWVLGMLEPMLMLAIAAPVGGVGGYAAGRALASAWLVPHLPVGAEWSSAWFALGVVAASVAAAALTVRSVISEPLTVQIAASRRPVRAGRWGVLLRLTLIAGAVVTLGGTLSSGGRSRPAATDMALPILTAGAAGVATTVAAVFAATRWARWSAGRHGTASYVASRTIARRREGTWVVLPLTAALAIAVFAAGVYSTAATWRASDAATKVGADTAFPATLPLADAVTLTHAIDPDGQWLMALGGPTRTQRTLVL